MEPVKDAVTDGQAPATEKQFSQADVDAMIQTRLEREKQSSDKALEDLRTQAAARIRELTPGTGDADQWLSESQHKAARDQAAKAELSKLFGPGSDSAAANKLAKADPAMYRSLRSRAAEFGLVGRTFDPPKMGSRSFRPNNT